MIHYTLDSRTFASYNDYGWLLCNDCVDQHGPSKRKAFYDYILQIVDRENSQLRYLWHCLPFPCNKPFRVGRSNGSVTENCILHASNAYFSKDNGWMISALLGEDTYKVIPVQMWEKLNPELVTDATRFFTSGSMFQTKDSLLLDV